MRINTTSWLVGLQAQVALQVVQGNLADIRRTLGSRFSYLLKSPSFPTVRLERAKRVGFASPRPPRPPAPAAGPAFTIM